MEWDEINGDGNITISYNTITGVNFGFLASSTGSEFTTSGLNIIGNDISCTVGGACIWDDSSDAWHHNGVVFWPGASGSSSQIINNVVVADNYIHDFQSSSNGSICGGGNGCVTGDIFLDSQNNGQVPNILIYNNVLVQRGTFIGPSNGAIVGGNNGSGTLVYNNTIVDCGRNGYSFQTGTNSSKAENNIVTSDGALAACANGFWSDDASPTGFVVDYNDYYNWSAAVAATNGGGTTYSTLANWRSGSIAICSGGCDAHSISTNPSLNSDYTIPPTSPAHGMGVNLTSLGIAGLDTGAPQYFGVNYACGAGCLARPSSGAWDIGAYPTSGSSGSGSGPQPPTGLIATVN
jgi:hypothetical protein